LHAGLKQREGQQAPDDDRRSKAEEKFAARPGKSLALPRCALVAAEEAAMATATNASTSQTVSQARGDVWRDAAQAAPMAVNPMATHPSRDGGKFSGTLHGFADVTQVVCGAGIDGIASRWCERRGLMRAMFEA